MIICNAKVDRARVPVSAKLDYSESKIQGSMWQIQVIELLTTRDLVDPKVLGY